MDTHQQEGQTGHTTMCNVKKRRGSNISEDEYPSDEEYYADDAFTLALNDCLNERSISGRQRLEDTVCCSCSSFDIAGTLDAVITGTSSFSVDRTESVWIIGILPARAVSSCPLCRLFYAVRWQPKSPIKNCEYCIVALPRYPVIPLLGSQNITLGSCDADIAVLAVVPMTWAERSLGPNYPKLYDPQAHANIYSYISIRPHGTSRRSDLFVGRIPISGIDYEKLRDWLDDCQTNHALTCEHKSSTSVAGLKVIDCIQRVVVVAPDSCAYIALSYIWGRSQPQTFCPDLRQGPASWTIEDAIVVALNLGYQYLWVDYYCINGQDQDDRHYQIRNMHRIYAGADVTIIASEGEDSSAGLPGVGTTHRNRQSQATVGNYSLISFVPARASLDSVVNSKWNSRAWTYQEAVLSRRRLIFTGDQVIFECRAIQRQELLSESQSLSINNAVQPIGLNKWGTSYMRYARLALFPSHGVGDIDLNITDRISEYTARQLSYARDAINGMLGIFEEYAKKQPPVYHLWGIPILSPESFSDTMVYGNGPNEVLLFALCWTRLPRSVSLYRNNHRCSERVQAFPSWSWAGWQMPVSATYSKANGNSGILYQERSDAVFDLELENGENIAWANVANSPNQADLLSRASPCLYIEALIAPLKFSFSAEEGVRLLAGDSWEHEPCNISLDEGLIDNHSFRTQLVGGKMEGALLWSATTTSAIMIIRCVQQGKQQYERGGLITANHAWDWELHAAGVRRKIRLG
ncbi:MAG: hypothetical protein Q9227_009290 [Pyrenula ochraceoflavens]